LEKYVGGDPEDEDEARLRSDDSGAFRQGVVEILRRRAVCVVDIAEGRRG
jgi:hypothetical protein